MSSEEAPKIKYERLQRRLQETVLNNYPNPERRNCPDRSLLESLALRPFDESLDGDSNWDHVTHCSECYRDFLECQSAVARRKNIRKIVLRSSCAILVLLATLLLIRSTGNVSSLPFHQSTLAYNSRTINIESMSRSSASGGEKNPFFLDRERQALTIHLPTGSKAGQYEFRLKDKSGREIITDSAAAVINKGVTAFVVHVDLSALQSGRYKMEVRQVPWDWDYYPVVLR